jgi:hypothetical protein
LMFQNTLPSWAALEDDDVREIGRRFFETSHELKNSCHLAAAVYLFYFGIFSFV